MEAKEAKTVVTVEECPNCGLKNKRKFQKGDYILKEGAVCPKCGFKMYIKFIYSEPVSQV